MPGLGGLDLTGLGSTLLRALANDFPWTQLTYLDSHLGTLSEFTRILPQLVNIVKCHIRGWGGEGDNTVTHHIITLPALQKLYLDEMPLPPSLIAPRLTHIRLGSEYLNTLPLVVSRSGCDLQSVTILTPQGATVSFSALQHCPTICDLNIESACPASNINTLCHTLTVQHDSPTALPKLNSLMFTLDNGPTASGFHQLNLETLVAMLRSRWSAAGCTRICHVHIEAWRIELRYIEGLLIRLVEFDDGELSLWLTDFDPIDPSWGDPTYTVPFNGSCCHPCYRTF
ncbi:hypothetical protein C8J57DRAFT_1732194 [Mycena rebaudengoi]|nr:hypothetical protein C8J57DRAFT_1732194 [Mycena rebaudengoi]